jgi:hypothetical protein
VKSYQFVGQFDEAQLYLSLLQAYPHWIERTGVSVSIPVTLIYDGRLLTLHLPDDAVDSVIEQVVAIQDVTACPPVLLEQVRQARADFQALPEWAAWSASEAEAAIQARIWSGQTKTQIDAWIDANVTTLAQARVALKLIAGVILDIRAILVVMTRMLVLLREIVVRMRA